MVNCEAVKIEIYGGSEICVPSHSSVIEVLQACAGHLGISSHYFSRLVIQSHDNLLLCYRTSLPKYADKCHLMIFDELDIEEMVFSDLPCFLLYFNQCKTKFLRSDFGKRWNIDNKNGYVLHTNLFLTFARSNGVSIKRADILRSLKLYCTIFNIDLFDERGITVDILNNYSDQLTFKQYMLNFLKYYAQIKDQSGKRFNRFTNVKVTFEEGDVTASEVLISLSIEFIEGNLTKEIIQVDDIRQVSSPSPLIVDLLLDTGAHCTIQLPSASSYETFLTILDHNIRLKNFDTTCLITSVFDIPVDLCIKSGMKYSILKEPIFPFEDVSSKELKLALEIYGKCHGWYGLVQNNLPNIFVPQIPNGLFYFLIYCVDDTVCEKMICCEKVENNMIYYFSESSHKKYSSLAALIRLCKVNSSQTKKAYYLSNQFSRKLLDDIQNPEVQKIFVSQADFSLPQNHMTKTWLATIYKGKFNKTEQVYQVTYFSYNDLPISENFRKKLYSEIGFLTKVQHENLLNIQGLCIFLDSPQIRYITEDYPFTTLHEHLKTDYAPSYSSLDQMNPSHYDESTEQSPTAVSLLFKYVRYLISGLQFLHEHKICHTLPAPQHILLDHVTNTLKLFDTGIFGKIFNTSPNPEKLIQASENHDVSVLRWMNIDTILKPGLLNSSYHDRYNT